MDFDSQHSDFGADPQRGTADASADRATPIGHAAARGQAAILAGTGGTQVVLPNANGVVVLPEGVDLSAVQVSGRDLVIVGEDGTRFVIPDGAIVVPQLVIEGVAVSPLNLAALLIGNEPQPAAGPVQSSGGNFASAVGPIQAAYDLGNLLPYTELTFDAPRQPEIIPARVDREPGVVVITPDQPAGAVSASAAVTEAGLPARGAEPAGTAASTNGETTTGVISYSAPDGFGAVAINGVTITAVGQTIASGNGVLTVTSIAPGSIGYSYTLTDNLLGQSAQDQFAITVTDADGDVAAATLSISVADDAPIALDDTDRVAAGSYGPEPGNVMTGAGTASGAAGADQQGADGARITAIATARGTDATFDSAGNLVIDGLYGTLTMKADGSYSYVRAANSPGGVTDTFTYTLTDGDGSTDTATLAIAVADSPASVVSLPTTDAGTVVSEAGLPARGEEAPGTATGSGSDSTTGTIVVAAPDGPAVVTIGGVVVTGAGQVITGPGGALTIISYDQATGTIEYEFTLTDNTTGDSTTVTFPVTVTDADGDTDSKPLVITILDDAPIAVDDSAAPSAENAPITVAVLANDVQGADSVQPGTVTLVPGSLTGTGALANNADGTFTYTPGPAEEGTITFEYSITDGDGDSSTATVTITLTADSAPTIAVAGDSDVLEAGLPARGSEPAGSAVESNGEYAAGTIAIATGNDTIAALTVNGVDVTAGGSVTTASGVLTVTVDSAGEYSYSYRLIDNTLADPSSDSFALTITDSDGSQAATTLVIAIIDDAPAAADDAAALPAGGYGPVGGTVLANDTPGADGAEVVAYSGTGASGAAGSVVQGLYGTLTIAADGTFSYTRDADSPGGVTDTFGYTIRDGDGDEASATLTITIPDNDTSLDVPAAGEAGTRVLEAALPFGSNPADPGEATSGTIAYTAPDGPAILTIDGQPVAVGTVISGAYGTLTIEAVNAGSIAYSYVLTTNTSGDATHDDFTVRVEDQDGDFTEATLAIAIVDDVPGAVADTDTVTEDGPLTASGNVITDAETNGDSGADTPGADGAAVAAFANGAAPGDSVAGLYGTLTISADGSYTYTLDNANPPVQGLDGTETLTESFGYTITDGDGDPASATLTITINGVDDPVVITGLNPEGAELSVYENDLADGSSPDPALLTQGGTFTVGAQDGLATIAVGGVTIWAGGAFVPGQSIVTAYGTLTFTGATAITTDANGDVTAATVAYSFTLGDNTLAHTGPTDAALTDSYVVTVTDTDGSVATDTLAVTVVDDAPNAANDTAGQTAENRAFTIDALANDTFGADGVATSNPAKVFVSSQAAQGTVTYDPATGLFTYTPVPGAGATGTTDSFQYTIVDGDGDVSVATVTVSLQPDSLPTGGAVTATVDDDGLAGGNLASTTGDLDANAGDAPSDTSEASFTGTLAFNVFADGPAAIAFAPALAGSTATVGLETVTYAVSGSVATATITGGARDGTVLFQVELLDSATGAYRVTLLTNVLNAGGPNEEATDATASIAFTVTDADGSATSTTLGIVFDDDAPSASGNTASVGEGSSTSGNVLTDGAADAFGADGGKLLSFASGSQTAAPDGSITTALGTLTIHADGSYTYASKANSTNTDTTDSFTYTIVDGDGDTATATLVIAITNAAGQVSDSDVNVDESGLDTTAYHGSQAVPDGEFGSGAITVAGASGTLVYSLTGANANGDGAYGTLVLDSATGQYKYTLDTPFTDAVVENSRNVVNGAESFAYEVRDANGNLIGSGTIAVNITDDVPTAKADPAASVAEDSAGTIGGNVTANDTFGADGAKVTAVIIDGKETAIAATGTTTVSTAEGVYTFTAGGAWTFDPAAGQNQSSGPIDASFTYRLTDGDGDFSEAIQPITVTDGAAPANPAAATLALDDQWLADGSTPVSPQPPTDSETIAFVPGSDPFTSIVFGDTSGLGGGLTWVRVDDTHITGSDGSRQVVTLTLSLSGSSATVTATLIDNYLHTAGGGDQTFDFGNASVVATDTDGDAATALVDVRISDDLPSLAVSQSGEAALLLTTHDAATTGAASDAVSSSAAFGGVFTLVSAPGADGAITPALSYDLAVTGASSGLTSHGQPISLLELADGTIVGYTGNTAPTAQTAATVVFAVSVSTGGVVTLTQYQQVDHPIASDLSASGSPFADQYAVLGDGHITLSASATIVDSDGDTATDRETVDLGGNLRFADDGPAAIADSASVIEGGTVQSTVMTNDAPGADGYVVNGPVTGVAAGSNTDASVSGGVGTAIAGTYGTLTLNADGSYTYKANANAISSDQTDTFVYTVTDFDGDTATTTLTVNLSAVTLTGVTGNVTVYEAALDTATTGSDVAHGTVTGSNPASTGETATGSVAASGATGYTIAGATDNGATLTLEGLYGTLVLNKTTGAYTYTLTKPYTTDPATNDGTNTEDNRDVFTYTATDANGNTTTGQILVDIVDDVPVAFTPAHLDVTNRASNTATAALDSDTNIDNNVGADQPGTVRFSESLEGASALTSGLKTVYYHVSADGQTLLATTSTTDPFLNLTDKSAWVFQVDINQDGSLAAANDLYQVTMYAQVDATQDASFIGGDYDFVGGNTNWVGFVPTGQENSPVNDSSMDLLITPTTNGDTANGNANEVGSGGSGSGGSLPVSTNQGLRFDFVNDLLGNPTSGGAGYQPPSNHTFDGHYYVPTAGLVFGVGGNTSSRSTVKLIAYDDKDTGTLSRVGEPVTYDQITKVVITLNANTASTADDVYFTINTTAAGTYTYSYGGATYTVIKYADGSVDVGGIKNGTGVSIFTADGSFTTMEAKYVSGADWTLTGIGATLITDDPVSTTIPVELVDHDGDIANGTLDITFQPLAPTTLTGAMLQTREAQRTSELVTTTAVATAIVTTQPEDHRSAAAAETETGDRAHSIPGAKAALATATDHHDQPDLSGGTTALLGDGADASIAPLDSSFRHTQDAADSQQQLETPDRAAGGPVIDTGGADDAGAAHVAAVPASLFAAGGADGVMQALMALAPAPASAPAAKDGAPDGPLDAALADLAGGAMVDAIVDHFAAAGADGHTITLGGGDIGSPLLFQSIDSGTFAALHSAMPDAVLDASQLAAAAHA